MKRLTLEEIEEIIEVGGGRGVGKNILIPNGRLVQKNLFSRALAEVIEYQKLEQELGCPIEVLIKAIKDGIWFINKDDKVEQIDEELCFNTKVSSGKFVISNYGYHCKNEEKYKLDEIYLEDYGKTWWLREDQSE